MEGCLRIYCLIFSKRSMPWIHREKGRATKARVGRCAVGDYEEDIQEAEARYRALCQYYRKKWLWRHVVVISQSRYYGVAPESFVFNHILAFGRYPNRSEIARLPIVARLENQ